ncbi:uncharacterized protein LOC121369503 isoform X3 [Gigantopelta aegis]|uniref:uncharacterized protein LOC121369503 isoform X3 n=1 Tax=Gigantopelta aegis TaxID=1735272 RepID=UPI001B88C3F3|nr:uncharacterized protein LOC121369503 isoform X3 [Gigantopelta aegis]
MHRLTMLVLVLSLTVLLVLGKDSKHSTSPIPAGLQRSETESKHFLGSMQKRKVRKRTLGEGIIYDHPPPGYAPETSGTSDGVGNRNKGQ